MESCGWSHLDDDDNKTLEKDWEKLDWKSPTSFSWPDRCAYCCMRHQEVREKSKSFVVSWAKQLQPLQTPGFSILWFKCQQLFCMFSLVNISCDDTLVLACVSTCCQAVRIYNIVTQVNMKKIWEHCCKIDVHCKHCVRFIFCSAALVLLYTICKCVTSLFILKLIKINPIVFLWTNLPLSTQNLSLHL